MCKHPSIYVTESKEEKGAFLLGDSSIKIVKI